MRCQLCGQENENLIDHHLSYKQNITIPLCRSCHTLVHNEPNHLFNPRDQPICPKCGKKCYIREYYVYKNGKKFGPYYKMVHGERRGDKVVQIYHGYVKR